MLFLISPAKTLDFETPVPAALARKLSQPLFPTEAQALIEVLRKKSARQVAALMDLSPALSELNVARYQAWQAEPDAALTKPAVRAFAGDVYDGLQAASLSAADLAWAQSHLVILSGLYGVLRPLDVIQPYRLEMGTALRTGRGKSARASLYAYWGDRIAAHLNQRQAGEAAPVIVNLASIEYARAALHPSLAARVIQCSFEDWKGSGYKIISFFAKRARGVMARWAIRERLQDPARLVDFAEDGYTFAAEASSADQLVFRRRLVA